MDDTVDIEWLADEATVPYAGHFETGKTYTLPTEQAERFIEEGKAQPA